MSQRLRSRVQTRLAALGINPFEADRRAGLARGYVNDLLIGKKASMRPAALGKLAEADAVIFAPGWETARGCRMEHLAAEEYGIRIVEG